MNENFSFFLSPSVHTFLSCALAAAAAGLAARGLTSPARTDWRWISMIGLLLVVGRWPSIWFPFALNPDESQFIAGAHTLRIDPMFWRSVNGMTSGPLNFYALWPAGAFLGYGSYLGARLTAVALLLCTFGALHLAFAQRFSVRAARLGGLPAVCFLSFTAQPDFIHYSSELLSIALLAVASNLALRVIGHTRGNARTGILIGFLLGLIPFAKLQAAPLGFLIGLSLVAWSWWQRPARIGFGFSLLGGALLPLVIVASAAWAGGVGEYALHTYFDQNINYVSMGEASTWLTAFRLIARPDPSCPLLFAWMGTGLIGAVLLASWLRKERPSDRNTLISCVVLLLVSVFCVLTPRRAFPHYLLLTVIPWTGLMMALAGTLTRGRAVSPRLRLAVSTVTLGSVGLLIGVRAFMAYPPRPSLTTFRSDFSGEIADAILAFRQTDDRLAVWGWRTDYFVLTDLPQATRDAVTESSILPSPEQFFAQRCFLEDLEKTRPAFFVDAVGPGNFQFDDRATESPDHVFPALADWVEKNYTLLADRNGSRIYLRNERIWSLHRTPALSLLSEHPSSVSAPKAPRQTLPVGASGT